MIFFQGQMYTRVMDSDQMVKHNYLASSHMTNVWETQIPAEGVSHCKCVTPHQNFDLLL